MESINLKYDYKVTIPFRNGVLETYVTLHKVNTYGPDDTHNGYFDLDYDIERLYHVINSSYSIIDEDDLTHAELEDIEYEIMKVFRECLESLNEDNQHAC